MESRPNQGSSVRILLPIREKSQDQTGPQSTAPSSGQDHATDSVSSISLSILLVEDNEAVLNVNRRALISAGHEVSVAPDGETALQLVGSRGPFDVVVTDIVMPGISGLELADRVRDFLPHQRFVFVSGYAEDALQAKGLAPSQVDILHKPFSPAALVERVREAAGQRASELG
jgi:CheY-like chemotaxis protein